MDATETALRAALQAYLATRPDRIDRNASPLLTWAESEEEWQTPALLSACTASAAADLLYLVDEGQNPQATATHVATLLDEEGEAITSAHTGATQEEARAKAKAEWLDLFDADDRDEMEEALDADLEAGFSVRWVDATLAT